MVCPAFLPDLAAAHVGDLVVPVYELSTVDLPDLHDGTLADWEAVLEPSLDHRDFASLHIGADPVQEPVPQDEIAFEVFLAWHQASQRIYAAVQRFDATFQPRRIPESPPGVCCCCFSYDSINLGVDGDHSGGLLFEPRSNNPDFTLSRAREVDNRQAQGYQMVAEVIGDRQVFTSYAPVWALDLPYQDAGGFRTGEAPSLSGYELYVTPWDWLDDDLSGSQRSMLEPWKIIGLQVGINDYDETFDWARFDGSGARFGLYTIAGIDSEELLDGLLIPCSGGDCSAGPVSAVQGDSWARIKASFTP